MRDGGNGKVTDVEREQTCEGPPCPSLTALQIDVGKIVAGERECSSSMQAQLERWGSQILGEVRDTGLRLNEVYAILKKMEAAHG